MARPLGGQHPTWVIKLCTNLVIHGCVSFSGVQRVINLMGKSMGVPVPIVDYATIRGWILRLGLDALNRPLEKAADWIWITDHSVQIGKTKLLVILGVRKCDLPAVGQALSTADLDLIALVPMEKSNGISVHEALKQAAERTGVPRAIVSDHGADLLAGILLWKADHAETLEIYDVTHKAACLLKGLLEKDLRWTEFVKLAGTAKFQMAQTEMAGLLSPSLREKARFMNLKPLIVWGLKMLVLLERSKSVKTIAGVTPERLNAKLGWLVDYESALHEWMEWLNLIDATLEVIRTQGHSLGTPYLLDQRIASSLRFESSNKLALTIREFVAGTSGLLQAFERLPGSSEAIESVFGKFKKLERQQSRGGFTSLVLSLGVLVGKTKDMLFQAINDAMKRTCIKNTKTWVLEKMGMTVYSQNRIATEAAR